MIYIEYISILLDLPLTETLPKPYIFLYKCLTAWYVSWPIMIVVSKSLLTPYNLLAKLTASPNTE